MITAGPEVNGCAEHSPDGTKILFGVGDIWSVNPDGSGKVNLTNHPAQYANVTWSPDSQKIAFRSNRGGNWDIWVMNRDGSGVQQLTNDARQEPLYDWQPILKGYPRPKAATPLYLPGPRLPAPAPQARPPRPTPRPWHYASCTATQTSNQLTVGSFDANAKAANSTGYIRMVRLGDLTAPAR